MNRAERRKIGLPAAMDQTLRQPAVKGPDDKRVAGDPDQCHGVCRECGRRRILWLPGRWCERCLVEMAQDAGELFNADAFGGVEGTEGAVA